MREWGRRADGIYAIVDASTTSEPLVLLEQVLAGGVRVVQYRAKTGVDLALVRAMHARTTALGAILLINDDLEAALEADGWHAGQDDIANRDLGAIRARLGGRVFGVSAGIASEAVAAERMGADYVGVGPFAATVTKGDAGDAIGVAGITSVAAAVTVPVVAIGGIGLADLPAIRASGARMAAVISAIASAPDPTRATRDLVAAWAALA